MMAQNCLQMKKGDEKMGGGGGNNPVNIYMAITIKNSG